eukprot:TRINITY_DN591_c0_g2_i5.p1 TRINITY_DN591_c0_g2~~TRINITY_DN591_c0_g2_i5.p1  ORF type:complete len:252 (+),score=39.88 TRINITY_DN591_c0_g2_i5:111-758(+)
MCIRDRWDMERMEQVGIFAEHAFPIKHVNPIHAVEDEELIASVDEMGTVLIWDIFTKEIQYRLNLEENASYYIHRNNYNILISAFVSEKIGYVRLKNYSDEVSFELEAIFRCDGYNIVTDSGNYETIISKQPPQNRPADFLFVNEADECLIVASKGDDFIEIYSFDALKSVCKLKLRAPIASIIVDSNFRFILVYETTGSIQVYVIDRISKLQNT